MFKMYQTVSLGLFLMVVRGSAQVMVFDDFNYSDADDTAIGSFNNWTIVNGIDGPPSGASYLKSNVDFIDDPDQVGNRLLTLTSSNTNLEESTTHARIQTADFTYGEGTYAARVFFDDSPRDYQDPVVQAFYAISSYQYANDPGKYSEVDFEYLPWDSWSGDYGGGYGPAMFMTTWEDVVIRDHLLDKQSYAGWHVLVFAFADGERVDWWIDGEYMGGLSRDGATGTSIYPESLMNVSFANWVYTLDLAVLGSAPEVRSSTMKVDWMLYLEGEVKTTVEILDQVEEFRSEGIYARNRAGNVYGVGYPLGFRSGSFHLYPNPAHTTVASSRFRNGQLVEVLDLFGHTIGVFPVKEGKIDVSGLRSGQYLVKPDAESEMRVSRFVKN